MPGLDESRGHVIRGEILEVLLPRARRHRGELLRPVRRVLGVDRLGQNKVGEMFALGKSGARGHGRSEHRHLLAARHRHGVLRVLCAGIDGAHDQEDVLELRAYPARAERQCTRFL